MIGPYVAKQFFNQIENQIPVDSEYINSLIIKYMLNIHNLY